MISHERRKITKRKCVIAEEILSRASVNVKRKENAE